MELEFHGAAQEVGRSCIELRLDDGDRFLFDVGIKFSEGGLVFPEKVLEIKELDGVFLSHAHLDHSGGLPLFENKDLKGPIFSTKQTLAISRILLKDSYKIARIRNLHPAYDLDDIKEVYRDSLFVEFDQWYVHRNIRFMFLNAGHIPGSAMILVEAEGKRILYTGDINTRDSQLMYSAHANPILKEKRVDVVITESTYGDKELPDREELRKKFIQSIKKTIKQGGSVLIPTFALGRAQEILIMLSEEDFGVPIFMEGMCNTITRKILQTPSKYVKNKKKLSDVFYHKIQWIGSPRRRNKILKKQGIFITTSGMMQGGPVLSYLKELWHNPKNKVTLMGFQCKNTNGRHLLEEGFTYIDGWKTTVKCQVEKYDFSGHADSQGIKNLLLAINPKKIFFQHGDPIAIKNMKDWSDKGITSKTFSPAVGSVYKI
ncbi:MBL fold metallo-hydrolase [Candidatus Woesearchaeota archaeon]|nr:MBL fold metallo-hydrolase [Candidatus Woesearchaeota archaeon]MCF7900627.1 MBL fold metallo-hydrolase [Candidatus Woesearchaeota archaeon]MCF8013467.1 MBL fold metallo-hydrolase [Candidatus Woesearchaeota archaeon]